MSRSVREVSRSGSDPKVQFTHQQGPGPTKLGPVHPLTGPDPRTYGVGPVQTQVREGQDRPSDSLLQPPPTSPDDSLVGSPGFPSALQPPPTSHNDSLVAPLASICSPATTNESRRLVGWFLASHLPSNHRGFPGLH